MRATPEKISELRAAHPRGLRSFDVVPEGADEDTVGDQFIFRRVTRAEHTRYRAEVRRALAGGTGGDEASNLARALCVFPGGEAFDELREKAPAIAEEFGQRLLDDATGGVEVREGKL